MNFELAREIYGLTPFCVDSQTLPAMINILDDIRSGVKYDGKQKNSNLQIAYNQETKLITRPYQLNTSESFEGVGVINIDGPILLNSGASTIGMKSVSAMMKQMSADNRVKGFILLVDSGGGAASAVELMVNTINEIQSNGKPVYTLIDEGGVLGSAAYGLASASKKIYYQSNMSMVGSLGTMIQANGRAANSEHDSVKYIRLYATKSVDKNIEIEEAFNNDNYKLIINNLLDPINENFISLIKQNRTQLSESDFTGKIHFAKDVEGSFVDGKSTMKEVVNEILSSETISQMNTNINQNSNIKMTRAELLSQHPELHNEVMEAGATAESERVQSWLAHLETDQEAVMKGIVSGAEITPSQREKFIVKQSKQSTLKNIVSENADDVTSPESATTETEKEVENAFDFDLK